ncbi:alpha/beta-hydrolase [Exidia glandulosa HHB12029]|uniref:Alpha/beta-hydrolase n=1 Tax=Exidia glandulosa HHB12029 TaxID=1314781 RepID=A0A165Q539_EXIGL|nr:alpha/beta-hydrolase [Exidia glandulosa HHB12029]
MSFCKDCIVAVRQDGTPTGRIEKIGGVDTYVALPQGDYPKDKAILYLTDIFGIKFPNNQLLADDFARNGFQVYMPDYLHDDPVNDALFADPNWEINRDWFPTHMEEYTRPLLDAVIVGLKERGITVFGATGYCFGGRYSLDLAFENLVHAIAITHPSAISTPADFERLLSTSRVPLLINSCEVDLMFPIEDQKKADEVLGGGKYKWGYERTYWEGCVHGFAVRGDMSDPLVKAGKEGAFKATVEWFIKYL